MRVQNLPNIRALIIFTALLIFSFFTFTPRVALASCTNVASNTCPVAPETKPIWCSVSKPPAGNVSRYCCDAQSDCDNLKNTTKQQIQQALASNDTPFPEIHFPCDLATKNPEFASLRPYQAAVCGDAAKAYYCSNSLIFTETFSDFPQCENQGPPEGHFICNIDPGKYIPDHTVSVDLADSNLPILGNTDNTGNSIDATDQMDDGTKVSEYVSWYLGGTVNKAEYGATDPTKLADFAGPIQKIMPQAILEAQRIKTLETIDPNNKVNQETEEVDPVTQENVTTGNKELANHNQIVVCYSKPVSLLPSWLTNFLGIGAVGLGKAEAEPCYTGGATAAKGSVLRLSNWDNTAFDQAITEIRDWILQYHLYPPGLIDEVLASFADRWPSKIPPLPWKDNQGKPFESDVAYQKAYHEWRGELCAMLNLPLLGVQLVCISIPGVTNNDYADLFPYIPLANTRDTHGAEADFIAEIQPSNGTQIENPSYDIPKSAPLWMAHNQEDKELSEFLNTSYTPKGLKNEPVSDSTEPPKCRVVNVSTNTGDNLFPGQTHGIEVPGIHYTITQAPCNRTLKTDCSWVDENNHALGQSCEVKKITKCDAEINITLPTVTKTAWADEIYASTTANSASTFRRIYPKVTAGAPVSCISDSPASTSVTYTPHDPVGNGEDNFKVKDPTGANTTENPTLLFPHFGSVYDYFLKGIQQALRPQGFGEGTPVSGTECSNLGGAGDCSWNMAKINQGLFNAAKKYNVPDSILRAIFEIENADAINNPSSYQCVPNEATALGVGAIVDASYKLITCADEQMSDKGMCGTYPGKLSRCNFSDAFELMARELLYKAGRLNGCKPTGGIDISEKTVWYNAACNFYGSHNPDNLTINYSNEIPANERRQNGQMNYCDIVCWRVGACSGSNYPDQQTGL